MLSDSVKTQNKVIQTVLSVQTMKSVQPAKQSRLSISAWLTTHPAWLNLNYNCNHSSLVVVIVLRRLVISVRTTTKMHESRQDDS
jgi:hypothetical protein